MNFKEVMEQLDYIWDKNNHQRLLYPSYSQQFLPENWKVKICTAENGIGATPGVFIRSIYTGFDWDNGNILIYTDKPIWQSPPNQPIYKWQHNINGISYECSACNKFVGKTDKFCKHCGKQFSNEIKKGIGND